MRGWVVRLARTARRFRRDKRGAMAVLVAVGIVALVGFLGIATDAARGYIVKARLGQALDAAALAGGREMESPTRDDDILMFFNANFPPGYLDAVITGPIITEVNDDVIRLEASAKIETTFMRLLGFEELNVASQTEVTREMQALDVVLAVDMSGSMNYGGVGGGTRIEAARAAALELVDILFGADSVKEHLNIGLVPWTGKVNVTLNAGPAYDPNGWTVEVVPGFTNPLTGLVQTVLYVPNNSPVQMLNMPGAGPFVTKPSYVDGSAYIAVELNGSGNDKITRGDNGDWDQDGYYVGGSVTLTNTENGGANDGTYTIVAISGSNDEVIEVADGSLTEDNNSDRSVVVTGTSTTWAGCVYSRFLDDADEFNDADIVYGSLSSASGDWMGWEPIGAEGEPVPGGDECAQSPSGFYECVACLSHGITPLTDTKSTIQDGINELLYPEGSTNVTQGLGWAWRVLMPPPPFDEADPDPDGPRLEAIVLLTDGENTGWPGDGYKGTFGINSAAQDEMDDRLRALAATVKASGVYIYTIQFANNGTDMQDLLKEVATEPGSPYYHYAPDAASLSTAFQEIAEHLSQLRLSK